MEKIYVKDSLEFVDESNIADVIERSLGREIGSYIKYLAEATTESETTYNELCEANSRIELLEEQMNHIYTSMKNIIKNIKDIKIELTTDNNQNKNIVELLDEILEETKDSKDRSDY